MNQTIVTHEARWRKSRSVGALVTPTGRENRSLHFAAEAAAPVGMTERNGRAAGWLEGQVSFATTARLWLFGVHDPTMVGDWLHGGTPKVRRKCR